MTDKDKAIEFSNKFKCITIGERCKNIEDGCYEMAAWKEKEILDCAVSAYCECCDTKECEDYFDIGCECDWKLKFEKELLKKLKK